MSHRQPPTLWPFTALSTTLKRGAQTHVTALMHRMPASMPLRSQPFIYPIHTPIPPVASPSPVPHFGNGQDPHEGQSNATSR